LNLNLTDITMSMQHIISTIILRTYWFNKLEQWSS